MQVSFILTCRKNDAYEYWISNNIYTCVNFHRFSDMIIDDVPIEDRMHTQEEMHDKCYPNSNFLFPADTKNGTITYYAVYGVYRRVCDKLGLPILKDLIRGPHSFRKNAITDVANATNGNMVMASSLFGNSPQVAISNYYGGANLMDAKDVLEQRKYLRFG